MFWLKEKRNLETNDVHYTFLSQLFELSFIQDQKTGSVTVTRIAKRPTPVARISYDVYCSYDLGYKGSYPASFYVTLPSLVLESKSQCDEMSNTIEEIKDLFEDLNNVFENETFKSLYMQNNADADNDQTDRTEPPVKLGEKIYAVYGIAILCHEVYAIGKEAFLFNPFTNTLADSWKWDFSDEDKTWSKSLDKAKEILLKNAEESLNEGESLDDLKIVQIEENYWEIQSKKEK